MMEHSDQKRQHTRSRVWADIEATLNLEDPFSPGGRNFLQIRGKIEDLGSSGMFFKTEEPIPVPVPVEITIDFDPDHPGKLSIQAHGETVRKTSAGVGIRFTGINLQQLQQCILARMNRV